MNLESLFVKIGEPGRYQVLIFILLLTNYFPVVFNHVIMAFYGSRPPHKCYSKFYETENASVVYSKSEKCEAAYTLSSGLNVSVKCGGDDSDWKIQFEKGERETTIVTEWDLVCDQTYLSALSITIYFCGVMVGGVLFGHLADVFGRKPVMMITLFLPVGVGVGISFVPWYWLFATLRFVQGMLMQGLQSTTYTMAMEMFLPKHRPHAAVLMELVWGAGVMLIPAIAYLIKTWRYIQLAISLPSLLVFWYICVIPESLRWLIATNRLEKAETLLNKITKTNKLPLPSEKWQEVKKLVTESEKGIKYTFMHLMKTPNLRRRSLVLFYLWFAISVAYYGLTWLMTGLAGNKYLTFFIGGAVEFVAYALVLPVTKIFGRKKPLIFYFFLASSTCITSGVLLATNSAEIIATAFAIAGRFGMGGLFCIIFLYTSELYPTVIRNIGLGSCAFWTRAGGVVAPQIMLLEEFSDNKSVPLIIFGAVTLLGGILTFVLPETHGVKLPDTIEDAENFHTTQKSEQNSKDDDNQINFSTIGTAESTKL